MKTRTASSRLRLAKAAGVATVLTLAWISTPDASAQLGSLIVTITSPSSGATVSGTIPVNADVTIIGSLTVQNVQFKLDGVNLGAADTTAPYSVQWNTTTASNGSHTLTAVARDILGVNWSSDPVTVTVSNDTTPPTVAITSPASGAAVRGTIAVSANASDNVGVAGVQFKLDGANLGAEDTASPYSVSWNTTGASNGSHTLTAVARDAAGNTATSSAVTVTVDNTPPTVTINQAAGQADPTSASPINFTAVFSEPVGDFSGADVTISGTAGGTKTVAVSGGPATYNVAVSGMTTGGTVIASIGAGLVHDAAGNANTASTSTDNTVTFSVADTTPPTVAITSPASGAAVRGTITVSANASDNVGVAGVQFQLDGANLGAEDTASPYSVSWNTAGTSNGSHTLTAVARDAAGNTTTSSAVTVTVDNAAPTVAITSPANGAAVRGTIAVSANASDNVGVAGVQFQLDGANLGVEDTASPYSVSWSTTGTSDGSHTLTAVARDAAGNITTSSAVTVTVDNTPPTVTIDQAAGQADPASASPINFTAVFSEAVSGFAAADVAIGGTAGGTKTVAVTGGPATYNVAVSGMTTSGTVIASIVAGAAVDAAGNASTASTSTDNTVTFNAADTTPPTVSITSPASGAAVRGTITVSANASDNVGVAGVQFKLDGANLGAEDTASPYSVSWNTTTASEGSHTLTAVARDAAGNTTTSSAVTVTVDNTPPTVTINQAAGQADPTSTSPINFTVVFSEAVSGFAAADVTISGTAGGTKTVVVSGGPVTYNVAVSGMTGSGTVTASIVAGAAVDGAGNASTASTSTDNTVTFSAPDTTPPTVAITSPASGAAVRGTITVSANASDNVGVAGVQFQLDGANLGVEDTASPYSVSWNTTIAGDGSHTLTAIARDAAGNTTTSSSITVTVDNTPPTVAITAPSSGATVSGTTTVSANASDNAGVVGVQFKLDGANLGAEVTTSPYSISWDTTTAAEGSHTLTAIARDAAGNAPTSAPVTVTVTTGSTPPTATRFEDTDLSITYTDGIDAPGRPSGWWHGSRSRGWSGVIASFNRSQGARARFSFTGTTVRWIGFLAPWAGIADVYVDDVFAVELDLYATTEQAQAVVFERTGLPSGNHTITVEAEGRKNDASTDYAVVVDAFDVEPTSPLPTTGMRVEETGLTFTAGWTTAAPRAWSGGTAQVSSTPGEQATLTFIGTEVRWMGLRGPQSGIARVYLDGAFQSTVDTYAPTDIQAMVFTATGLAADRHTLRIDVTGQKNAASTGASIYVDALDVRGRVEDADPSIAYSAGWGSGAISRNWSGSSGNYGTGTAVYTRSAQATISFTGTAVSWIGLLAPWTGMARVLVDGAFVANVDTYAPTEQVQAVLYTATGLADGPHTFTVDVSGQKNAASTDSLVIVDAFDVTLSPSAPTITRYQETDPATSYTGTWSTAGLSFWSGETASYSGAAGDTATFTFTGTAVRWIGQRAFTGGIANVFLDGVFQAQVDTYVPLQEEYQAAMYVTTGLANTSHTLAIEVTGQKNPFSQGTWVFVDAFDVF